MLQLVAQARGQLVELALEVGEEHLWAGAADELGVEGGRAAAHGGESVGGVLQLAELGVDVDQLVAGVAAVAPEASRDQHEAEDQEALADQRESEGEVPEVGAAGRERPTDGAEAGSQDGGATERGAAKPGIGRLRRVAMAWVAALGRCWSVRKASARRLGGRRRIDCRAARDWMRR